MSDMPYFSNLCFPRPRPAQPNPKHKRKTPSLTVSVLLGKLSLQTATQRRAAASAWVGVLRRSWEHSTVYTYLFYSHSIPSSFSLTLLCMTTTLWLSTLSQVSMALQMLQILSRAGAWWSGQPKSNTWQRRRTEGWLFSLPYMPYRKEEMSSRQVYLWVQLADVITLLTEVEQLRKKWKNNFCYV